ncbi:hypothetical protein GCM10010124_37130 [Pilimelia terevasa]|uniref:VOC domain-containing protein n=1 Tax=Pilimelia terevasa TaxID=53372 RepID=A0A8J3BQ21_9ACTN|nr:VOC family protein [Pilimelia terevasa]GGK40872.1 hypothetical protein GCM10010124_37130 [Pilimelia terevasa]
MTTRQPKAGTSTARRAAAALLGAVGLFILSIGIGVPSWSVVAVGAALGLVAVGLVTVQAVRGGERAWMAASAHVIAASPAPANQEYGRAELELVLTGPGLPTVAVKVRDPKVPVDRWPRPGTALPVLVAVDDRRNVRVQWDEVPAARPDPVDTPRVPTTVGVAPIDVPRTADAPTRELTGPGQTHEFATPAQIRDFAAPAPRRAPAPRAGDDPAGAPAPDQPPAGTAGPGDPAADRGAGDVYDQEAEPPAVPAARRPEEPVAVPRPRVSGAVPLAGVADVATVHRTARPAGAGPVHGVGATLTVGDLDRAVDFYTGVLDFATIDRGPDLAILASGDTRLLLRTAAGDGAPRGAGHLNLEVGDIDASHQALRAAGVRFLAEPAVVGGGARLQLWSAPFRDPDGNGLAITQWRPAESAEDAATDPQQVPPDESEEHPEDTQRPMQ